MKKMFDAESPAMIFLHRLMDLVLLNLCWVVSCVPLITIGAATVSLYGTVAALSRDWARQEDTIDILPFYFRLMRREFRQSTWLMLVKLAALGVLLADFRIAFIVSESLTGLVSYMCWIPAVLAALVNSFLYPTQAKFANRIGATLKNAALIAFSNPAVAISSAVLNAIPFFLLLKKPELFIKTGLFWILLGVSLIARANWSMMNRVFEKYYSLEYTKEDVT